MWNICLWISVGGSSSAFRKSSSTYRLLVKQRIGRGKNGREEAGEKFKQARRGPTKEKTIGKKMERRTGAILTVFQAYTFAIWSGGPTFFECVLHNYIITLNSELFTWEKLPPNVKSP